MAAKFGYWNVRARGQSIRLLMAYTADDVDDKVYAFETNKTREEMVEWFVKDKFSLGLDFPNLPYYIDDTVKITQSLAILRYLGRKYKLDGSTEEEKCRIDMVTEELLDWRRDLRVLLYDHQWAEKKDEFVKRTSEKLKRLEGFLADNPFFAGQDITWADFHVYEILYQHCKLYPEFLKDFRKLASFMNSIEEFPRIKAYMTSEKFIKAPCMGPAVNRLW